MSIFIEAISYYLPQEVLTNKKISNEHPEWSVEKIASKTGIMSRHISASDEFVSDLAIKAAKRLFFEYKIDPSTIDFVLLCTQSPDYPLPTTACIIQDALHIPKSAGALDFNLGCSGFIYGLSVAKGLIAAKIARKVLLLTSETYSKYIHKDDKSNRTIFGDGASASLISDNGFAEIKDFSLGTDGTGALNLIVKQGGSKYPVKTSESYMDNFENVRCDANLYMNGPEIFTFTGQAVPQLVKATIEKNNLRFEQVDGFIFHQANLFMLNFLKKKIKIPDEKFFVFIEQCGNTVSSTIPIALKEASETGFLKGKKNILLAGFGVGYSWGGVIIEIFKT